MSEARPTDRGARDPVPGPLEVRPVSRTEPAAPKLRPAREPVPEAPAPLEPGRLKGCQDLERRVRLRRDAMRELYPGRRHPTDATIRTQFTRVAVLYRKMYDRELNCREYEWTRDTARVLQFIATHWNTESSRNAHRAALAAVLRNLDSFDPVATVYARACAAGRRIIDEEIGENTLTGRRADNYLEWDQLAQLTLAVPIGTADAALMGLYVFIPPRRLLDYSLMRIARRPAERLPRESNYLVLDDSGQPTQLVFNRFKTDRTFGQQVLPVTEQLANVLRPYVHGKPDGAVLFPNTTGEPHSNFSRVVSSTFRRHTGREVTVDLLRSAFISMALGRQPTLNARKALAHQMAHSTQQQAEYQKISVQTQSR
jgi:integrase